MTSHRVLHVDDEPDIRAIVELSVSLDPELSIRSCASGQEAIETASVWLPDLILLDVMMPVMDGPAMLVQLQKNPTTADILVVFMTARAQARELTQLRSLGAAGIISKPFNPMTLAAQLRQFLPVKRTQPVAMPATR